jgi:hypothetical protein
MKRLFIAFFLMILFSLSMLAFADTVELKTGEHIEGDFKGATDTHVLIETGGQRLFFDIQKVRAVYFGKNPGIASVPSGLAFAEALRALKDLRSATSNSSITYGDYSSRTNDTKIKVDRYFENKANVGGPCDEPIKDSMQLFSLASSLWNLNISRNSNLKAIQAVAEDPIVLACPGIKSLINDAPTGKTRDDTLRKIMQKGALGRTTIIITYGTPELWNCAAAKIEEADRACASVSNPK